MFFENLENTFWDNLKKNTDLKIITDSLSIYIKL